jgi:hypothetical protein
MKILLTLLAFGWLAAAPCAWAQDDPHAGHHPPAGGQAVAEDEEDGDDDGQQAEGHEQPAGGRQDDPGKAGGRLQENMKRMRALMARMQETTDPAQRRALLGEHLQVMREQVKLMLAQAGGHAHGGAAGAGTQGAHEDHGAQPSQGGSAGGENKKCAMMEGGKCKMMENKKKGGMMGGGMMMKMHEKMEQRVQMLEQLLEQMVEHEAVEHELESR